MLIQQYFDDIDSMNRKQLSGELYKMIDAYLFLLNEENALLQRYNQYQAIVKDLFLK